MELKEKKYIKKGNGTKEHKHKSKELTSQEELLIKQNQRESSST